MALRFYNTLTQEVEDFHPLVDNVVRMYTCGPTVYNFVHIGNFRTFTFQDVLRRWLAYRGYRLNHVMNVTDVDDKIMERANEQSSDPLAFLRDPDLFGDLVEDERFTKHYLEALESLHEHGARATLEAWEQSS